VGLLELFEFVLEVGFGPVDVPEDLVQEVGVIWTAVAVIILSPHKPIIIGFPLWG